MKIETDGYNLIPYKNLLHVETFMAWDDRIASAYLKDLRSVAYKLYHDKPWAKLVDRRLWELHTPEAERLLSKNAVGQFKTPLTHIAVVAGKSEIKRWQVDKITQDAKQFEVQIFVDIQDAKDWLASYGYHMAPLHD